MKSLMKAGTWKMWLTLVFFNLVQFALWAQETPGEGSTTSTSSSVKVTTTESTEWYTSPWVWVIGAAVFILLLVALLSGRSGSRDVTTDRVKETRIVEKDTDV